MMKRSGHRQRATVLALLPFLLAVSAGTAGQRSKSTPPGASPEPTVQVLVAYYSRTGNTEKMAQAVAEGARRVPGTVVVLKRVEKVTKEDLEAADAIALGSPTYFANIAGAMKVVIDNWNWKWKVDFTDKVGGAFATAGGQVGGKEHVTTSLLLFMIHNRMVVAGPLYQDEEGEDIWAESGAGAITGILDPGVSEEERDGARRLGDRLARLAKKLVRPSQKPAPASKS
jgi:NAD(P)H dehydrogenase (quinone)